MTPPLTKTTVVGDDKTRLIAVLVTTASHCPEALFEAWVNDDLRAAVPVGRSTASGAR